VKNQDGRNLTLLYDQRIELIDDYAYVIGTCTQDDSISYRTQRIKAADLLKWLRGDDINTVLYYLSKADREFLSTSRCPEDISKQINK